MQRGALLQASGRLCNKSTIHQKHGRGTIGSCRAIYQAEPKVSAPAAITDPTTSYSHLKDPAHVGGTSRFTAKVQDMGGEGSLQAYMTLPVEQYFVLDPKQIRFLGGNSFLLLVPRIHLFNVWIEPVVEITVRKEVTNPPSLVLEAQNCKLRGSEFFQSLKLDERFALRFVTELTWKSEAAEVVNTNQRNQTLPAPIAGGVSGEINGNAKLDVWCEVISPFNLMPRSALEASCNVVMTALVNTLLPLFVRNLAADYIKWSNSEAYRKERAARQAPLS